ncbi:LOW QUALITY PROTEIN: pectinesterase/pectinesterase inhibitor PPE8B-like [Phalaenopsis equestris]|uniref:LOW QUALITY PROTEIN: pectinesterase/pectinesterase inhibitor PPE8B-like n=1 Tax=Phalaenopsis equestris TaxID=78828 RepID=UPI0009E44941|nr:LOW QUALITY PROTEIN: pectinesterase/pectinesterase inhibitor PPE8B-like [Phalaenopsis equestris]
MASCTFSPIIIFLLLSPSLSLSAPTMSSGFLSTLHSTINHIQQVSSIVSTFAGTFDGDLRLSSAISDCLDLLDFSSDELSWSLSSVGAATTASVMSGTGDRHADLRSWLSAALGNQDTCKESLSSTGSLLASLASDGLDTITSLLSQGIRQLPAGGFGGRRLRRLVGGFPRWVTVAHRRLLQAAVAAVDLTVAKDGSGNYTTVAVSAAGEAAPAESGRRFVIYVKRGVYVENVEIKKKKWNLMLVGDGMNETIISGSRNFVDGWTTFRSATFAVAGKGFIARDITFENTAGASKHQAVALRSDSDLSVFYRCGILGYQDTLYAHSLRQFYRECRISGTVDFIFGNAAAVLQNCQILSRLPLPDQKNTITAQGRKDPDQNTGFVLQFCNITADVDLSNAKNSFTQTYLGRPWKEYSQTAILQSYIDGSIRPEGWLPWNGDFALSTLNYAEYMNFGPGSGVGGRVKWPGYHVINSSVQAANFTVSQFIEGNLWLPSTGVKYTAGLEV